MEETKSITAVKGVPPDRTGWQREYETVYLLPPDQTDEAADKLAERLRGVIAREGGRVIKFTQWGRRKTAFEVARNGRALYVQVAYLGNGKAVSELERYLKNAEEVSKFQTGVVQKKLVDPESRPTEPDVKLAGDIEERPTRVDRAEGAAEVEGIPEELADEGVPEIAGRE